MVLTISMFLMTVTALRIEKFRILSFDVTCFETLSGILSLYLEAFSSYFQRLKRRINSIGNFQTDSTAASTAEVLLGSTCVVA